MRHLAHRFGQRPPDDLRLHLGAQRWDARRPRPVVQLADALNRRRLSPRTGACGDAEKAAAPAAAHGIQNGISSSGSAPGAGRIRRLSAGRPRAIAPAVEEGQHTVVRREVDLGAVAVRA